MDKRKFNALLRSISTKGKLDPKKMAFLDNATKELLVLSIVRHRQPVVKDLIPPTCSVGDTYEWLHAMGYLYETKGRWFTFVHTSEQKIF